MLCPLEFLDEHIEVLLEGDHRLVLRSEWR